ncbi:MAG: hypothetical protein AABX51_05915 [Nanoarchaeota archaeon]
MPVGKKLMGLCVSLGAVPLVFACNDNQDFSPHTYPLISPTSRPASPGLEEMINGDYAGVEPYPSIQYTPVRKILPGTPSPTPPDPKTLLIQQLMTEYASPQEPAILLAEQGWVADGIIGLEPYLIRSMIRINEISPPWLPNSLINGEWGVFKLPLVERSLALVVGSDKKGELNQVQESFQRFMPRLEGLLGGFPRDTFFVYSGQGTIDLADTGAGSYSCDAFVDFTHDNVIKHKDYALAHEATHCYDNFPPLLEHGIVTYASEIVSQDPIIVEYTATPLSVTAATQNENALNGYHVVSNLVGITGQDTFFSTTRNFRQNSGGSDADFMDALLVQTPEELHQGIVDIFIAEGLYVP